jgi:hypothetical protein
VGNVTGQIQTTKTNDYGFTSYKVNGSWFGADTKGPPRASEGETVSFEAYDKAGKDGRVWPTIKLASFKKSAPAGLAQAVTPPGTPYVAPAGSKDTYWADKAKTDEARDPRISYQGALERAIAFADLAFRAAALPLPKADNKKLDVLAAFVDETANRFLAQTYAATVPMLKPAVKLSVTPGGEVAAEAVDLAAETDEDWS